MCLIFVSLNHHPHYKLVVAANRDEFYKRATVSANYWTDHPDLLAGRDLEAMGTWMGITRSGRLSLITNYRDPKSIDPKAPSRGQLVSNYLTQNNPPDDYLRLLSTDSRKYNGYNLITGNQNELWYFSNYQNRVTKMADGFHALSNHLLDSPWPKVVRIKEKLTPLLEREMVDPEILLDALYDELPAMEASLPDTGVGVEWEKVLSPMFIKTSNYGTRCSTVILIDKNDNVTFVERVYNPVDFSKSTNKFEFRIPGQ